MDKPKIITIVAVAFFILSIIWIAFGGHPGEKEAGTPDSTDVGSGKLYQNPELGFEIYLPEGYVFNEAYVYEALGPDKAIHGVEFKIPSTLASGTNLSADSHMALEKLSGVSCKPEAFLSDVATKSTAELGGTTYQYADTSGAAAGNRYDESVYVTEKHGDCYALRYFIHSTNIGNYEPGTISEFDRSKLLSEFD